MAICKLFRTSEWADFVASGHFAGSADDRRDGFIHLSFAGQLQRTARKHFAGERPLVIAWLAVGQDPALRLEPSGAARYPHLYRPLVLTDVIRHEKYTCEEYACGR